MTRQRRGFKGGRVIICPRQVRTSKFSGKERLKCHYFPNIALVLGSLTQQRVSRDSRSSRVDSGSVDMETPQSLSPRSPLNTLETLDSPLPVPNSITKSSHSPSSPPGISPHLSLSHNNNNHVINLTSPEVHPVPVPVPVSIPQPTPLCISHSPSPATPLDVVMIGGTDSTQSLNEPARRLPVVPPRRCRTRSPTPNTSKGELFLSLSSAKRGRSPYE